MNCQTCQNFQAPKRRLGLRYQGYLNQKLLAKRKLYLRTEQEIILLQDLVRLYSVHRFKLGRVRLRSEVSLQLAQYRAKQRTRVRGLVEDPQEGRPQHLL